MKHLALHPRTSALWLSLFLVTFAGSLSFAAVPMAYFIDSAMVRLVDQRYDEAREIAYGVLADQPENTDALYMLTTIKQTELLDYESYTTTEGENFIRLADSILVILKDRLRKLHGTEHTKCLFYLGNLHGGKGLILAKRGNWINGIKAALNSVSLLKKVRLRDSTFYAAYLGLGVFNYYLSQNLGWVPFMGDKSDQGIEQIETATKARFPYNYAAQNSLSWILIDRNQYAKADSIVSSVLAERPDNTIFLRIKARIKLWTQRYEEAIEHGQRLSELSRRRTPVNWSDLVSGYQIVAKSYYARGQHDQCARVAKEALAVEVPDSARDITYVKKHLKYLTHYASGKAQGDEH